MSRWVTTFGELSVRYEGRQADLGGRKQRLLLALLLSRANSVWRVDELIDAIWDDHPPRTARKNLQVYVSKLRRIFGDRLTHVNGGYRLGIDPQECDLLGFEQLARAGRRQARAGDTDAAVDSLARALSLWHERPLAEFDDVPRLVGAVDRLEELFLSVLEDWAELEADRGGHRLVLDRLEDHVRPHVLRERLAAAWMRTLAAVGRVNEALAHYESVRRALAQELGVPPGPTLTSLHAQLLRSPALVRQLPGPGNQLPRAVPDFVGRAAEVHRAVAHFSGGAGGVMVVSGPVGIGKSAFAVHVAHLLAQSFPDGLVMVELGRRPLSEVLRALLDTVGLARGGGVAQALARWRSWVACRRLLVILDDAARAQHVRALLPGCGSSGVLVTSRYRLSGMEAVARVELPAFSEAECTELLGRIIGWGRVMADRSAARSIVGSCEGLPLAVRITGSKLDSLRHVRLADYADRLRDAPCLLNEMRAGELVLRDRYETFWYDLPEPLRLAYRRLVAHTPPFGPDQAAALPSGALECDRRELESLLECNLLTAPTGEIGSHLVSYGMSGFTYEFARGISARSAGSAP